MNMLFKVLIIFILTLSVTTQVLLEHCDKNDK